MGVTPQLASNEITHRLTTNPTLSGKSLQANTNSKFGNSTPRQGWFRLQAPAHWPKNDKVLINGEPMGLVDWLDHYYMVQKCYVEALWCNWSCVLLWYKDYKVNWSSTGSINFGSINYWTKQNGCCKRDMCAVIHHCCQWSLNLDPFAYMCVLYRILSVMLKVS